MRRGRRRGARLRDKSPSTTESSESPKDATDDAHGDVPSPATSEGETDSSDDGSGVKRKNLTAWLEFGKDTTAFHNRLVDALAYDSGSEDDSKQKKKPSTPAAPPPEPVAPVPPPPEPVAPRPQTYRTTGMSRYERIAVFLENGELAGHILYNENACMLDAHCAMHTKCAVSKSSHAYRGKGLDSGRREGQGRPLGFLVAWLRLGHSPAMPADGGRDLHFRARLGTAPYQFLLDGTSPQRVSCREYIQSEPRFQSLRDAERPRRLGEPLEPPGPV